MRGRMLKLGTGALVAALAAMLLAASAQADFHLIKIKEVSGSSGHSRASYIELQMYAPGQTQLAGHDIEIWDEIGVIGGSVTPIFSYTLAGPNPINGQNQRTVLIGDTNVQNADFYVPEDDGMGRSLDTFLDSSSPGNLLDAGAICFEAIPVDCVSWGGTNFFGQLNIPDRSSPHFLPLSPDFAFKRRVDQHGCITALDAVDDTNDNAEDFVQVSRDPTPNGATPDEKLCPVSSARCGGLNATRIGSNAADVISGTPARDVIAALGGKDTVRGLAGNDVLCGGKGRDRLIGGGGRDRLLGGPGRDVCKGGPKKDVARKCEVRRRI